MFKLPLHMIRTYVERRSAGNAQNFGFPELEEIAIRMEKLEASELTKAKLILEELRNWHRSKSII